MTMAWGLQVGEQDKIVAWVMQELFKEALIPNMESLLEWAHPGWASNFSKFYANKEEGIVKGIIPFINWPLRSDEREPRQE